MNTILVVDDDASVLAAFERFLGDQGYRTVLASRGEEALARLPSEAPDVVVMDIRMPGLSGLETARRIREIAPRLPVIIMTGHATTDTAIEATKLGAFDYQLKPLDPEDMLRCIEAALERRRLMTCRVELDPDPAAGGDDAIVGQSRGMRDVYKAIGRVADTDATVLIRGETGTGKELVARAVYQHSRRAQAPLVVVNCVAIPEPLLESAVFGHEKGAFTGAEKRHIGKFEQANGGTLFLDEIGDMPLALQGKLLRVLQERTFERLGGAETIPVDVRILAASHRDLEADVAAGRFREDLYHRLRVFTIDIPALRDRKEDIPRLAAYFVRETAGELGTEAPGLPGPVLDVLTAHTWPGNVRELQHCVQRAMILSGGYPIDAAEMQRAIAQSTSATSREDRDGGAHLMAGPVRDFLKAHTGPAAYDDFMAEAEKALLQEALRLTHGNQTHAARLLGMARPTLKARMDRFDLGQRPS